MDPTCAYSLSRQENNMGKRISFLLLCSSPLCTPCNFPPRDVKTGGGGGKEGRKGKRKKKKNGLNDMGISKRQKKSKRKFTKIVPSNRLNSLNNDGRFGKSPSFGGAGAHFLPPSVRAPLVFHSCSNYLSCGGEEGGGRRGERPPTYPTHRLGSTRLGSSHRRGIDGCRGMDFDVIGFRDFPSAEEEEERKK